jgi:hypothetical protein
VLYAVDCINCVANALVVIAVNEGIDSAMSFSAINRLWIVNRES